VLSLYYKFTQAQKTHTDMKKLIVFSTILMSLLALNASAAITSHGHKYKASKSHHVKHHHGHADPSYQN
jgi:hypothetical protein